MSITSSELIWRKSLAVNDTTANGGRMSTNIVTTNVKNNIFPDVSQAERVAGSTKYRKVFIHVANDADLSLVAPRVYVESRTPGDDAVMFIVGTQRDTQVNITGSEQKYGSGQLNTNVVATATTMDVATEGAAFACFPIGMKIRISNKASVNGTGEEEFVTVSGCTYVGALATITFSPALTNPYNSSNTKVSSVYEPADVETAIANFAISTTLGTYNSGSYPVVGDSISTIEQDWTLTFTSPTAFNVVGDTVGSLGSFNISTDCAPNNPSFTKPYFTLKALGFGGTWANAETITFKTSPAAIPLWYVRVIPTNAAALSGNSVIVALEGESA